MMKAPAMRMSCRNRMLAAQSVVSAAGFGTRPQGPSQPQSTKSKKKQQKRGGPKVENRPVGMDPAQLLQQRPAGALYHPDSTLLLPFVGSIEAFTQEGKGRGIRTTRRVEAGELLLVCRPAAILTDSPGAQPQPDQLTQHCLSTTLRGALMVGAGSSDAGTGNTNQVTKGAADALRSLCDGSEASMRAVPLLADLAECSVDAAAQATASGPTTSTPATASGPATSTPATPPPGLAGGLGHAGASSFVSRVVDLNSYGEPWGDVCAWQCRGHGLELCSFLGVWPAMAMINHSCAPNASAMVLQSPALGSASDVVSQLTGSSMGKQSSHRLAKAIQRAESPLIQPATGTETERGVGAGVGEMMMLVRAAKALKAGEEVTIAYTGRFTTSPLRRRQALLKSSYDFSCSCTRCTVESQVQGSSVAQELEEAYEEMEGELRTSVLTAVEEEDGEELQLLQQRLLSMTRRLRGSVTCLPEGTAEGTQAYLLSWTYQAFELLALCSGALLNSHNGTSRGDSGSRDSEDQAGGQSQQQRRRGAVGGSSGQHPRGLGGARRLARKIGAAGMRDLKTTAMVSLEAASVRLEILTAVSPGSYQQAALSARCMETTREMMGKANPATQEALEACVDAHTARYGHVGSEILADLVSAHDQNDLVELLAGG